MTLTAELQKWRSHKIVKAGKILLFDEVNKKIEVDIGEEGEIEITPVLEWWKRAEKAISTQDEGYFVEYEDGYQSWSPTKAFEEGYSKIEENSSALTITLTNDEWLTVLSVINVEGEEDDYNETQHAAMDKFTDQLEVAGVK